MSMFDSLDHEFVSDGRSPYCSVCEWTPQFHKALEAKKDA